MDNKSIFWSRLSFFICELEFKNQELRLYYAEHELKKEDQYIEDKSQG